MKGFIEVTLTGTTSPVIIALSAISIVDIHTVSNARIVTNFKLQHPDRAEVIITSQNFSQVKKLIEEATK